MICSENLCARIAGLRRSRGLTQSDLAHRLRVTPQAVSKWERGLACPDLLCLDELADVLGVSIQELLVGEGEAAPRAVMSKGA